MAIEDTLLMTAAFCVEAMGIMGGPAKEEEL
jgi:hypothetical protein